MTLPNNHGNSWDIDPETFRGFRAWEMIKNFNEGTVQGMAKDVMTAYTAEEIIYPRFQEGHKTLSNFPALPELTAMLPDVPFPVYRGGSPNGFSWTTSADIAAWFAGRVSAMYKERGQKNMAKKAALPVYIMIVKRDEVLFFHAGRNEREVVLIPEKCADKPTIFFDKKDTAKMAYIREIHNEWKLASNPYLTDGRGGE